MNRKHGITEDTYKKLIIDSGAVYLGFTDFSSLGTLMGATRGGSTFVIEQEIKDMEVDGARGPMIGSRRITMVKATLTVNFIEHTAANLKRLIVGSTGTAYNVKWEEITRALAISDSDFMDNVTLVGEVSGDTDALGIQLRNVIADGNFEVALADKEEGVVSAAFTGHFAPADLGSGDDSEPWSFIWPDLAQV
jgi:hypothetical protein